MRARVGIAALVVASVGLLGCSGGDDAEGPDGTPGDGGGGAAEVGDLALTELSTLPFAVDAAVLVDQGLLVASGGSLRLVDVDTGEPLATPTATTAPADGDSEVVGLVASADGTPYALLAGPSCGVAEVDAGDLGLGEVVRVDGVSCNDPVVQGDELYLLAYDYADGDAAPAGGLPQYTYRLGRVDLGSGAAKAVDATDALQGYSLPFGSGLVRIGDEIDLVLQKADDEATPYVIPVDADLGLDDPEARPDLDGYGERIAGEVFFARPVVAGEREWAFRVAEAGQAATLALFEGDATVPLGEVAVPDDLGASLLGEGAVSLAAGADAAYLMVATGDPSAPATKLYRVS